MKSIIKMLFLLFCPFAVVAQSKGTFDTLKNITNANPSLQFKRQENSFTKNLDKPTNTTFEGLENIYGRLQIPSGLHKIWRDIQSNKQYIKKDFDFSKDFWVGIRLNFLLDGNKISSAYYGFEKPSKNNEPYTFDFLLSPNDFTANEGDFNYAFIELLKQLKSGNHSITIEATIPSKNFVKRAEAPITTGGFTLSINETQWAKWETAMLQEKNRQPVYVKKEYSIDYNIRLRYLTDSSMKGIFGKEGFKKNFAITCLQNPCDKGYMYANTFTTDKPCTTIPQNTCKEALITYNYMNRNVPLQLKFLVTIKDNGEFVQLENNQFGRQEIPIEKQNILSTDEIKVKIKQQFPTDSIFLVGYNNPLAYSSNAPSVPNSAPFNKTNHDAGFKTITETTDAKKWTGGFIYTAHNRNPNKLPLICTFDATNGKLLWVRQIYQVAD